MTKDERARLDFIQLVELLAPKFPDGRACADIARLVVPILQEARDQAEAANAALREALRDAANALVLYAHQGHPAAVAARMALSRAQEPA